MTQKQRIVLVVGIICGTALFALGINFLTGDDSVWSYMIPLGVVLATIAAAQFGKESEVSHE